ncbi:MAG: aminopeptidase P N-terminal domain-containing protein, partial [Terriglobia bacterium]
MQHTYGVRCFLRAWIAVLLLAAVLPAQEREPVEVYQARREALRQKVPDGLIVLVGYDDHSGPDTLLPFRQENNFYY